MLYIHNKCNAGVTHQYNGPYGQGLISNCPAQTGTEDFYKIDTPQLSAVEGYQEKVYVNVSGELLLGYVENLDLPDMNCCQYIMIGKRFTNSVGNYYLGNITGCKYSHDRHGHFMIHSRLRNEKFKIPSGKDVTFTLWSEVRKTTRRVIVTDNDDELLLQTKPTNIGDPSKSFSRFSIRKDSLLWENSNLNGQYLFIMELSLFDR